MQKRSYDGHDLGRAKEPYQSLKKKRKRTFKLQKLNALRRAKENPELSSAIGNRLPQKKFFRSRAHCNPLSHNNSIKYPRRPQLMDWAKHFGVKKCENKSISFVDVGCGFGGLTVALAREFPNEYVVGLEIRPKVSEFVRRRISTLRKQNERNDSYKNAAVLLTNAMKYLPNYFFKGQLSKMFFCFADPHFKRKNYRRRIISKGLLHIYSYLLRPGGILYTITDVEDLHLWTKFHCENHPCFEQITCTTILAEDSCIQLMQTETEESKKVDREGREKYIGLYKRVNNQDTLQSGFTRL